MRPGILIPLVLVPLLALGVWLLYRRAMRNLSVEPRPIGGGERLTAERLSRMPAPTWRTVFEIGERHLGNVDHVIVGPPGVIAVVSLMADRPRSATTGAGSSADPLALATAAVARGGVDDLTSKVGIGCERLATVYWGAPDTTLPPAIEVAPRTLAVEGQRLEDWLGTLGPAVLTPAQVDLAWQAVVTGIGRPDPLA